LTSYTQPCRMSEMAITVLAAELVSKIAAGEVVERPASVVKELVENALDAGATRVEITTEGGGVALVRVADDGRGIPAAEVELAFRRYATSKISSLEDLGRIVSLGFRGEALPSIVAVADVELWTAAGSDGAGTYLRLAKGRVLKREPCARPRGTTLTVRGLFRHLPARLKFLKSSHTENGHIANLVSQYALAFPGVCFSLTCDGHSSLQTSGRGDLRDAVREVYGPEVAQAMVQVHSGDGDIKVEGLVGPPSMERSSRRHVSFFVNTRSVRSALLLRATEQAYAGLLRQGRYPIVVAHVIVPADQVDVNVHPTKAELRFSQEQSVFVTVEQAIRAALGQTPLPGPKVVGFASSPADQQTMWMVSERQPTASNPAASSSLPVLRVLGQLSQTYIIAEGPEGLYLIDQHAAHERVVYERILDQWSGRHMEVQGLLQPISVELAPREQKLLEELEERLRQFGFHFEPFGDRSYLLRAIPAALAGTNGADALRSVLEDLDRSRRDVPWEESIAISLACHGAVRAGQVLAHEEMKGLIQQLESAREPRTCPHGRPTMIHLSSRQLEREFGRVG